MHAVLAAVSSSCPPVVGRLLMYYSPVRHSLPKQGVRLACIRHAASVHPEPGSNSPFDLTLLHSLLSVILLKFIDVVLFLFVSQRTTRALSALANALIYNAIFCDALQVFFSLFLKFFYNDIIIYSPSYFFTYEGLYSLIRN